MQLPGSFSPCSASTSSCYPTSTIHQKFVLEALPYVDSMRKQPLRQWGSGIKPEMKRSNVIDVVDFTIVDAEVFSSQNYDREQSSILA